MGRYDLTARLDAVGMKQVKLLEMIEDRYGEHVDAGFFSKAKRGQDTGPKAERILEWASSLLAERERVLGIENAYTRGQ